MPDDLALAWNAIHAAVIATIDVNDVVMNDGLAEPSAEELIFRTANTDTNRKAERELSTANPSDRKQKIRDAYHASLPTRLEASLLGRRTSRSTHQRMETIPLHRRGGITSRARGLVNRCRRATSTD